MFGERDNVRRDVSKEDDFGEHDLGPCCLHNCIFPDDLSVDFIHYFIIVVVIVIVFYFIIVVILVSIVTIIFNFVIVVVVG